jgi:hypothetical protein
MIFNSSKRAISAQSKRVYDVRAGIRSKRGTKPSTQPSGTDSETQPEANSQMSASSHSPQKAFSVDEKFELMSAYLDNEATEQERTLVEDWLANDPQLFSSYQQQMKLRGAILELGPKLFD